MGATVHSSARRSEFLVWLLTLLGGVAFASPAEGPTTPAGPGAGLREVGHGTLSWFGLRIYEARLWLPDGQWSGLEPGRPVALSLAYERRFSRAELIKITTGEFGRLGLADPDARARWSERLGTLWRDVAPGDTMTALIVPGGETRFYDGNRLLGAIEDPAFGPAYLSIWLDPRSAVRDLRAQLLGLGAR
jgi:hypothetical protein